MNEDALKTDFVEPKRSDLANSFYFARYLKSETAILIVLFALASLIWLPRLNGPIDLRWDGGVYYILGTSLAEGKGYKLLNEPGEIDAVQYPPLLPAIVAAHQLILGTNDPTTVGKWLRISAFIIFIGFIYIAFRFFKNYLSLGYSFLATLLCLFTLHVYLLSDLLFPEILFGLLTLLFILCSNKSERSRTHSGLAYLFGVLSYALRTVGIAGLIAWILESVVRKQFKQAVLRAILVLIPIICWQSYIASVESSYEYNHPAYTYQRAPYMFYNVSYARNVALVDPFTPEKGNTSAMKIVQGFIHNLIWIPLNLGETLTSRHGYWQSWLSNPINNTQIRLIISLGIYFFLYLMGLGVFGGLVLLLLQREWMIPLYTVLYLAAVSFTPFPAQYYRYLMPIVPLIILLFIVFLLNERVGTLAQRYFSSRFSNIDRYLVVSILLIALIAKIFNLIVVYKQEHQRISYIDRNNRQLEYRSFFYSKSDREYDLSIDYLRQHAKGDEIIAAGTPHWIYLRTGLKAVMPPFEINTVKAQQLLDSVPISYLIIGKDVVGAERYTEPVVKQFPNQWEQVYSTPNGHWIVYQRVSK